MLTVKDVATVLIEDICEGGFYGIEGMEATVGLAYICGMAEMAQSIIHKLEEEEKSG